MKAAEEGLAETVHCVHVGDREADIFELFAQPRPDRSDLLIRATHNRKVQHELGYLIPTIEQAPVIGHLRVDLHRNPKRLARTAPLQLRAMQVILEAPRNHPNPHGLESVTMNAILVEEASAPTDGSQPIRWLLMTTLAIETVEQVVQCVQWYSYRWLIDRFHYTLKSGCGIEALQLETAFRLRKALATYAIVAWRLMGLHLPSTPDSRGIMRGCLAAC